jgi:hypothetical protein
MGYDRTMWRRWGHYVGVILVVTPLLLMGSLCDAKADPDLLVVNWFRGVDLLDLTTTALTGSFTEGTQGIAHGPDGNLYISDGGTNQVVRYDGASGALLGAFTSGATFNGPTGLVFGEGSLYVSDYWNNRVLQFDGVTGAFKSVFYQGNGFFAPTGLALSQGVLYVGNWFGGVEMFDTATSDYLGGFASGTGVVEQIDFGPDGDIYVADGGSNEVRRYDSATLADQGAFTSGIKMNGTNGFAFAQDGDLYVADYWNNRVLQFDGVTGAYKSLFYQGGSFFAPTFVLAHTFQSAIGTSLTVPATRCSIGKASQLKAILKGSGKTPVSDQPVDFMVDGAYVGTGTTDVNGQAAIHFVVPESLALGAHTLAATFDGTDALAGSAGRNTLTVGKGNVVITVTAVAGKAGTTVTLKAKLTNASAAGLVGRTLSFTVNGAAAGSAKTAAGGAASRSYTIPAGTQAGMQKITVSFSGDSLYLAGAGTGRLVVR